MRARDDQLPSEFALHDGVTEIARVKAARGSPERPMDAEALATKVSALTGDAAARLDPDEPARALLTRFGL